MLLNQLKPQIVYNETRESDTNLFKITATLEGQEYVGRGEFGCYSCTINKDNTVNIIPSALEARLYTELCFIRIAVSYNIPPNSAGCSETKLIQLRFYTEFKGGRRTTFHIDRVLLVLVLFLCCN